MRTVLFAALSGFQHGKPNSYPSGSSCLVGDMVNIRLGCAWNKQATGVLQNCCLSYKWT